MCTFKYFTPFSVVSSFSWMFLSSKRFYYPFLLHNSQNYFLSFWWPFQKALPLPTSLNLCPSMLLWLFQNFRYYENLIYLIRFLCRVKNKNPNLFIFFPLWMPRIPSRFFLFVFLNIVPFLHHELWQLCQKSGSHSSIVSGSSTLLYWSVFVPIASALFWWCVSVLQLQSEVVFPPVLLF